MAGIAKELEAEGLRSYDAETEEQMEGNNHTQAQMNHHANQCNPNSTAHKAVANNHANQCNPNHAPSKGK